MRALLVLLFSSVAAFGQTPAEICAQHPSPETCPPLVVVPQEAPLPSSKIAPVNNDDSPIPDPALFFKPQPLPPMVQGPAPLPRLAIQHTTNITVQQSTVAQPIARPQPANNAAAYSQGYAFGSGVGNVIARARINNYCGKHPDNRHWVALANGARIMCGDWERRRR